MLSYPHTFRTFRTQPKASTTPPSANSLKRKALSPLTTTTTNPHLSKKPRPISEKKLQRVSDEDFRIPNCWGQVDPVGITQAQIPLSNAEAFRMRGWFWGGVQRDGVERDAWGEVESPRGTKDLRKDFS